MSASSDLLKTVEKNLTIFIDQISRVIQQLKPSFHWTIIWVWTMARFCLYFKTQNKICSVFSIDFLHFPWSSWQCYVLIFIWTCRYMISFLQTVAESKVSSVSRLAGALGEHLKPVFTVTDHLGRFAGKAGHLFFHAYLPLNYLPTSARLFT